MIGVKESSVDCINWQFGEREEMRVLRGVVYMMKSMDPRTEPRGTQQEVVYKDERVLSHLTLKESILQHDLFCGRFYKNTIS